MTNRAKTFWTMFAFAVLVAIAPIIVDSVIDFTCAGIGGSDSECQSGPTSTLALLFSSVVGLVILVVAAVIFAFSWVREKGIPETPGD